ncbi:hypothetical protein [Microlunatus speluncae]|uniref:hypothetical protein n=1 Tax=Microlunatus speluncae TaxID=2594267 RepID=UPI0012664A35|nr:hypothetical protein [Microlunatus speluncae]
MSYVREPTPTTPPPTGKPADGSDLGACRDGNCHVRVESGDRIKVKGCSAIRVVDISRDGITLQQSSPGGGRFTATVSVGGRIQFGKLEFVPAVVGPGDTANVLMRLAKS